MIEEIIKKLKYFIKIDKLTKELEFKAPKTQKSRKLTKYGVLQRLGPFAMKRYDIYKLIFGFQC